MKQRKRLVIFMAAAVAMSGFSFSPLFATDQTAQPAEQLALVEHLKTEAITNFRRGDLDKTDQLLNQAAAQSDNPVIHEMAGWVKAYDAQHHEFSAQRHQQYDRAAAQVKLLANKGYTDYAIDSLKTAYVLTDNKQTFTQEPWVADLIQQAITRSAQDEKDQQWLKAVRLYSDLAAVEPASAKWKDQLKVATRHFRLLAMYVPDQYEKIQDAEENNRKKAEQLLSDAHLLSADEQKQFAIAATQPTTKPADADSAYKIDWHQTLKGIQMGMLRDAMAEARANYYREISSKTLAIGGLNGVNAVATTKLLVGAFPGLANQAKLDSFLATVQNCMAEARNSTDINGDAVLDHILTQLDEANAKTIQIPEEVLVSEFADGAFGQLDPFSTMIWPSDVAEFNKDTQGEFSGVGIEIDSAPDGSLEVVSPLEDTPAYKAGIEAGDIITAVNGKSAKGISTFEAVKIITGPVGTPVTLTIKSPQGVTRDYTLIRQRIKVASVKGWHHLPGGGWDYFIDPTNKIAYMRLTSFTRSSADEINHVVDYLQHHGVRGLIFDLRGNPGGLLNVATEICDRFLTRGVIVSTHADRANSPNPPTIATAHDDGDELKCPMVVLVNQYSASASEITSGALKDDHRATLIGVRTFGKGSVQMLFPMGDRQDAYMKLTTAHYYLPDGRCINREENSSTWGVDPDLTVEMTPDQMLKVLKVRRKMDVLKDATPAAKDKLHGTAQAVQNAVEQAKTESEDQLKCDPQLSAGLLLLRLELAGNGSAVAQAN